MHFNSALISSLLFAAGVLASPVHEISTHESHNRVEQRATASDQNMYSTTRAGAIVEQPDGTFNSVTGTMTVPQPKWDNKQGNKALFAVAIDGGLSCGGNTLQAGIYIDFREENNPTYKAFFEFSGHSDHFENFDVFAGDIVRFGVSTIFSNNGYVSVENLTRGSHVYSPVSVDAALGVCGGDAGWIAEVVMQDQQNFYSFAKFKDVTFWNAFAYGTHAKFTPADAFISEMKHGDWVLTSSRIDGDSVTIQRQ